MPVTAAAPFMGFVDLSTTSSKPVSGRYSANKVDDFAEFHRLVRKWRTETAFMSLVSEQMEHPAFQRIVGLGRQAIPWVLQEVRHNPDFLVLALPLITGDNPVPAASRGKINEIVNAWLTWAERTGEYADAS